VRKLKEQLEKTDMMKEKTMADLKTKAAAPQNADAKTGTDYSDPKQISPVVEARSQLQVNQIEITNQTECH